MGEIWDVPGRWYVSPYNYDGEVRAVYGDLPESVIVRDVTLAEGPHQSGVRFTLKEMLRIAHALREAGITMIKQNIDNFGSLEFIRLVKPEIPDLFIDVILAILDHRKYWESLDQCKRDLDVLAEAGAEEVCFPGYNSWNVPHHIEKAMSKEALLERYAEMTTYARSIGMLVEAGPVDTTRVPWADLKELLTTAVDAGATSIAVYDSYGVATPDGMKCLVQKIRREFDLPILVHAHNDLGAAEAAEIGGIIGGATLCDLSVNGLGDRAGNASLEEVVMQLELNYGVKTGVQKDKLLGLSKLLEEVTGVAFPYVKPISGMNVFTHASEAHATMVLSQGVNLNYASRHEAYAPEVVGGKRTVRFGGSTLSGGMIHLRLEQLGLKSGDKEVAMMTDRIKEAFVDGEADISLEEFDALAQELCR